MFGGFKATLNMFGKKKKNYVSELSSDMFMTGAYRVNREDLYGFSTQDPIKTRPSKQLQPPLRPSKSTSNLVQPKTATPNLRNSTSAISSDPRGAEQSAPNSVLSRKNIKIQEKEQKKLEKKQLADQKKQTQEQAKREKLMKEQAKKESLKGKSGKNKIQAPMPPPMPPLQPQARPQTQPQTKPQSQPQTKPQLKLQTSNPVPPQSAYSTNTLDSSISRTSGPPPYSEVPKATQGTNGKSNVAFSKPIDTGSWDIISQHREQISRPAAAVTADAKRKQMVMDLNYNFGAASEDKGISDA